MGMYEDFKDINKAIRNNENLLRLLVYPPEDIKNGTKDPLDPSLPNILDNEPLTLKEIREKRIKIVPKSDDLVNEPICRIYLYAGKRKPIDGYYRATQQFIVDIFCEESFEVDLRTARISDQICEMLINKNITNIGKIKYVDGRQISAPNNYVAYSLVFEVSALER